MSKLLLKLFSIILLITFISGQVQSAYADKNLAPWSINDPSPMRNTRNDIAQDLEPGAIGNGTALIDLLKGKLPERIADENIPYRDETILKLREAVSLAIDIHIKNSSNISPKYIGRGEAALSNLIDFQINLTKRLYLFEGEVINAENYLLGFNYNGQIGLDIHLVNLLHDISPKRLAQYIYHENIPEHYPGNNTDRASHREAYSKIQAPIFGENEVFDLGVNLRDYINITLSGDELWDLDNITEKHLPEELEKHFTTRLKPRASGTSLDITKTKTESELTITNDFINRTVETLRSLKKNSSDQINNIETALRLIQNNDRETAIKLLDTDLPHIIASGISKEAAFYEMIMVILTEVGLYDKAKDLAVRLPKRVARYPKAPEEYYLLIAETQERAGKFDDAIQTLNEITSDRYKSTVNYHLVRIHDGMDSDDSQVEPEEKRLHITGTEIERKVLFLKKILMNTLAKDPNKKLVLALDSDIGKGQAAQIMPIKRAIDQIRDMKNDNGEPMFPNFILIRESASKKHDNLMDKIRRILDSGDLKKENLFLISSQSNIEHDLFNPLQGKSWIAGIDDSKGNNFDYLPVFETITLTMMAAINADMEVIKDMYNKISNEPVTIEDIKTMLEQKQFYILPKMAPYDPELLRDVYEKLRQALIAA